MSFAIVKKSLELFQDDLREETPSTKKKKTVNAMKLISSKKTGTWKELRRLQKQQRAQKGKQTKQTKSLIEKYQESQRGDFTKSNLRMLQKLSQSEKLETHQSKKILGKHGKRSTKVAKKKTEEKSIFTDTDFENFEKEYDFS